MADFLFPITICTHGKSGANEDQAQTAPQHKSQDSKVMEQQTSEKTEFSKEMYQDYHIEGHHLQTCHINEYIW
jgi:hypothetical protein